MQSSSENPQQVWRMPIAIWAILAVIFAALVYGFYSGLERMVIRWGASEEYGYGYIIPVIAGFFIWQKKNELAQLEFQGSWIGVLFVLLGGLLLVVGDLATIYVVVQYSFLVVFFGVVMALLGWRATKLILAPLFMLVFMIPLPNFLYNNLSSELQLISSQIGVMIIRLFDISVYLHGNVIDLGSYKLQVVEACSGLRYLFPLTALAFISAYLFRGSPWKKVVIFVSSAPITVLMNSFRIGVIGVLVEHWGASMAEGFLHDFEGWVVFMGCMAILVLEMWALSKIGKDKRSLGEAFSIDLPEPMRVSMDRVCQRKIPSSLLVVLPLILAISFVPLALGDREEVIPQRASFVTFPDRLGDWVGYRDRLDQIYIDALKFDDYVITNYRNADLGTVNFYVAYYGSQRKGESAHSPKSCIPGDGWRIVSHEVEQVSMPDGNGQAVNRLMIQKGESKQIVYYWFQQRGRVITNEYMVKWYLFWDALTRSRTDGALVRITSTVRPGDTTEEADKRIRSFMRSVSKEIEAYIPG